MLVQYVLKNGQDKPTEYGPDGGGRKRGSTQWHPDLLLEYEDENEEDVVEEMVVRETKKRRSTSADKYGNGSLPDLERQLSHLHLSTPPQPKASNPLLLQTRAARTGNALPAYQPPNVPPQQTNVPQPYNPHQAMVPVGTRQPHFVGAQIAMGQLQYGVDQYGQQAAFSGQFVNVCPPFIQVPMGPGNPLVQPRLPINSLQYQCYQPPRARQQ